VVGSSFQRLGAPHSTLEEQGRTRGLCAGRWGSAGRPRGRIYPGRSGLLLAAGMPYSLRPEQLLTRQLPLHPDPANGLLGF